MLNTVLVLLAIRVWGLSTHIDSVYQVTSWSTFILAILLTVVGAVWVALKSEREAPLHGLLVGLVAALMLLILNPDFTNEIEFASRSKEEV